MKTTLMMRLQKNEIIFLLSLLITLVFLICFLSFLTAGLSVISGLASPAFVISGTITGFHLLKILRIHNGLD